MPWLIIFLTITMVNGAEIGDPYKCSKEAGEIPYPDTDKPKECFFKPPQEKFAKGIRRTTDGRDEVDFEVGREVCKGYNALLPHLTDGDRLLFLWKHVRNKPRHGIPIGVKTWMLRGPDDDLSRQQVKIFWDNNFESEWLAKYSLYGTNKFWDGYTGLAVIDCIPILESDRGYIFQMQRSNYDIEKLYPLLWYCHRALKETPPTTTTTTVAPTQNRTTLPRSTKTPTSIKRKPDEEPPPNEAASSNTMSIGIWFILSIGLP